MKVPPKWISFFASFTDTVEGRKLSQVDQGLLRYNSTFSVIFLVSFFTIIFEDESLSYYFEFEVHLS